MSLSDTWVQSTHHDGEAEFTVTFADDDHRFTASIDGDTAVVEYEETLSWRGEPRVSEPDEDIYKALMTSDEMTAWLEEEGLDTVRRDRKP